MEYKIVISTPMGCVTVYTRVLHKYRYFILAFWLVSLGFSAWLGPKFLSRTSTAFTPPPDSKAQLGLDLLLEAFPNQKTTSEFAIYIWSR